MAQNIIYIPDIVGPTDTIGRPLQQQPTSSSSGSNLSSGAGRSLGSSSSGCSSLASSADAADELVMTDGSGFISQDLAELVPAVSAGELTAAMFGQGLFWPNTPLQVRAAAGWGWVWMVASSMCLAVPGSATLVGGEGGL